MRALVTGSNGFIGAFLVEKLLKEGHSVRCLVRRTSNLQWLRHLTIEMCYGDLRTPSTLAAAVRSIDVIFHLGGVTYGRTEQDFIAGNFTATTNLLAACKSAGHSQQKFVFVSSQAAGGPSLGEPLTEEEAHHPISMYGRSKRLAEEAVLDWADSHPATIIRPASVYGPRDKDFYKLFKMAQRGVLPMVGDGKQKISIIYIADLIDGIYRAGTRHEANGEIFFMSSDEAVTFSEITRKISQAVGVRTRSIHIPFFLVQLIVAASEMISHVTKKPAIISRDKFAEMKQPAWLCSNAKAQRVLDFRPLTGLEEGMQKTAVWYKENGWL
ncbi:NAD-dependent epimerase/dehydratase family protein [candidate division KSB1 bacterium]|nr:NAD-dependent epimerase/dehydratase family protein [candidate division KSB1 bacterium]